MAGAGETGPKKLSKIEALELETKSQMLSAGLDSADSGELAEPESAARLAGLTVA